MRKQIALMALCSSLIAGSTWAGPCANGAFPGPRVNCEGADLRGANLERANLFRTNFYRANLQGANLQLANVKYANMTHANLTGAIWIDGRRCGADSIGSCK